jgi:aryl-alcohol dehydrogenase-like predicted oxidoreductase
MEMRPLGTTDLSVSKICLGTMTWGKQNTEAEGHDQMDYALDHGVNFWDTAEMYSTPVTEETFGRTEKIIGTWFAKTNRRKDVILATKVIGRTTRFPWVRPHLHKDEARLDRQSILEACDASLKRLRTDYIDLYQLHWPERKTNTFGTLDYEHDPEDDPIPLEETLSALDELVKAGKVRHVGVSNETPWGVMEMLKLHETKGLPRIQSVQNVYNLLLRNYEVGMAEVSIREKCGLLPYSPLAMGALSGKYLDGARPEGARLTLFPDYFPRYLKPRAMEVAGKYVAIAKKHGLDPTEMALTFVNDRPFVTSNIIGATSIEQLATCIRSADLTLSTEVMEEIDATHRATPVPTSE